MKSSKNRRRRKRSKDIETKLVDEATSTSNSVHPSVPKESELHLYVTPNRAQLAVNTVSEPAIDVDTSVSIQSAPCEVPPLVQVSSGSSDTTESEVNLVTCAS